MPSKDNQVYWVKPDDVDRFWPHAAPHVERALTCGGSEDWSTEEVRRDCKSGHKVLWIACREGNVVSILISQVIEQPDTSWLHVYAVGGERIADWLEVYDEHLARYASELGLKSVKTHARDGVARMLKKKGWKSVVTLMERRLGLNGHTVG